jgi:gamma-glutamyltranspeptidase / glutathione hydrolase
LRLTFATILHRYLHALISSLKLAFADGSHFVADQRHSTFDPATLLSPTYLSSRAVMFDSRKALTAQHGTPYPILPSDTVYLAVTDRQGNGCSFVNSVADRFGSMIIPSQTGIVLQCRGRGFSLDPDHFNSFGPCKRPYNTIIPALVTDAETGTLEAVLGVMGGLMQPQGHVQVLLNVLLFGMGPQAALDAPRVCLSFDSNETQNGPTQEARELVNLEDGIRDSVVSQLQELGYRVNVVRGQARSLFGRGQLIWVHKDAVEDQRVYSAGSDPRGDGAAVSL